MMRSFEEFSTWQNDVSQQLGAVSKIKTAVPANIFGELPERIPWLD